MFMFRNACRACIAVLALTAFAQADTVIDFRGPPASSEFPFFDFGTTIWDGSTINVLATATDDDDGFANVHRHRRNGLGVAADGIDTQNVIDGRGPNETLVLTFDREIYLDAVLFANVEPNDDVRIFVDGTRIYRGKIVDLTGGFVDSIHPDNTRPTLRPYKARFLDHFTKGVVTGTVFEFQARHNNDNFRIAQVYPTPEPGTLMLLGAVGLGAGVWRRRRKRAAA